MDSEIWGKGLSFCLDLNDFMLNDFILASSIFLSFNVEDISNTLSKIGK